MWEQTNEMGVKRERGERLMLGGNVGAEQQSRKRRGGIRGGKAWWPDRQPVSRRERERKE